MEKENVKLVDFAVTARKYKTTLTKKFLNRPVWVKPVAGEIRSILPGTIVSYAVEVGQQVKAGDLLLVQESMKMQNRILSPVSGTVIELCASPGEHLVKGALMLTIKTE
ncbi:acetyl-CoA carboxylase biotin carboxyl carrier protein subunit [Coprobacter sp.]